MIKAVLFDFDGVMTTDATGSLSTCKYISAQTGLDYAAVSAAYRKHNRELLCGKVSHGDIWAEFCNQVGENISMDLLHTSFINTPIDENVLALARCLKNSGCKTGMITDNKADRIESIVTHHGWSSLFDVISVSAIVGSGKDRREIFLRTLESLSLDAGECVFIDNNRDNLVVPAEMGFHTIFFDDKLRDMSELTVALHEKLHGGDVAHTLRLF